MNAVTMPAAVLGRMLLGLYFLVPGLTKVTGFSAMLAYMTLHNVPLTAPLLVLTAALQIAGGIALIVGWKTRYVALMFAGMTLAISFFMHDFWNTYEGGDAGHELQNFIKNLGIFSGLLVLSSHGAPRVSLDARNATS